MPDRKSRKVEVALPRPAPSDAFLASGPIRNAKARARIEAAGAKVVADGKWPTHALVMAQDKRIRSATIERNSNALDGCRREWITAVGEEMVDAGVFPTVELVRKRAGSVRQAVLARVEDALDEPRRRWVVANGEHPAWTDAGARPGVSATIKVVASAGDGDASEVETATAVPATPDVSLMKRQITRLMAERAADRERIAELEADLAIAYETTRRALLGVQEKHAVYLNMPSAPRKV